MPHFLMPKRILRFIRFFYIFLFLICIFSFVAYEPGYAATNELMDSPSLLYESRYPGNPIFLPMSLVGAKGNFPDEIKLSTAALPIGYAYSADYADYFNTINRQDDFVAVGGTALDSLSTLQRGNRVLMFGSVGRLASISEQDLSKVDYLGFDLESGALTEEEQADLIGTVKKAYDFAQGHQMPLLLAPIARWSEEYGAEIAPYADVIVMQMMRYQHDPKLFADKVLQYSQKMREANPDLTIFVQLGTQREQTPLELYACVVEAEPYLDGIWIQWHYRDEDEGPEAGGSNIDDVKAFIQAMRGF